MHYMMSSVLCPSTDVPLYWSATSDLTKAKTPCTDNFNDGDYSRWEVCAYTFPLPKILCFSFACIPTDRIK